MTYAFPLIATHKRRKKHENQRCKTRVFRRDLTADDVQPMTYQSNPKKDAAALGTAEELKTFKELLDSGVITQEEFDAKKKQLLGL